MSDNGRFVLGILITLFVSFLFQALQFFGKVSVTAGRVMIIVTFIVGVVLIFMMRVSGIARALSIVSLALILFGIAYWGSRYTAQAQQSPPPSFQSNNVNGSGNTTGNVNQNGSGNNSVIGNNSTINNSHTTIEAGSKTSGWLLPGADPTPQVCPDGSLPKDAVALVYGNSITVVSTFPKDVIVVRDMPLLTIDRNTHGAIAVTLDIFGQDGKIIASVEKNKFTINPNNIFKIDARRSTLRVVDEYKKEVLNIRYLNRHALMLTAVLYYPGAREPLEITDQGVTAEGVQDSGNCTSGLAKDMVAVQINPIHPRLAAFTFGLRRDVSK
jgi:hypothetical protein